MTTKEMNQSPLNVCVRTTVMEPGTGEASLESEAIIDYRKSGHRVWLSKHSGWALNNGRMVTTFPTTLPVTIQQRKVTVTRG